MHRSVFKMLIVVVLVCAASVAMSAFADEPQAADVAEAKLNASIKGEWFFYRETPSGRYMTVKDHQGNRTVVTTYDPHKNRIRSHRSEYKIDTRGAVPVFRYRNKVVLLGPNAGARDDRESAYLFRVDGDRFYEVHGMLPDDRGKPSMIVWERLKDDPVPKSNE